MTLDEILKEIEKSEKIVILTHESPDGDAVGSSLAVKLMIERLGKKADVIIPEYSRLFNFLPSVEEIKKDSEIKNYDLAIAVDCATFKRMTKKEYFENAKKTIQIDHHGSNSMYADLNYVNPVSPACCEILAGMMKYFDIEMSKDIGTCIMTGIITDTGGFRHIGITSETFEFTADLIRLGVDIPDIYKRTLRTKTMANFELTKRVIERMEILEEGRVTFTYMTSKDEEEVNAEPGDHEGLVEIGRDIEGVVISIFIRQKENEDCYKVSLRSSNDINVSDICLMFGGGGHPRAAGALVQGTVEQVKEKLMKEVRKALNEHK
jgi:phosphoesterase RecJ-like protein